MSVGFSFLAYIKIQQHAREYTHTFHSSLIVQSYERQLKMLTNRTSASILCSVFNTIRISRLVADWSIEDKKPGVILYKMTFRQMLVYVLTKDPSNILFGQTTMDNPDKLTTQGTQEEENQNKNTPQCVLDTKLFLFSSAKQL